MTYHEYIKKYKEQILEIKKMLDNDSFKKVDEYIKSKEFKANLQVIKEKERYIHKDILKNIEKMQQIQ